MKIKKFIEKVGRKRGKKFLRNIWLFRKKFLIL
jgi:hypothetical protein